MEILNLGAGGFIGAHLTKHLLEKGYTVIGVDTHTDKIEEFIDHENLNFIEMDIRNIGSELDEMVEKADLVVDLIAYANPGIYVKYPLDVFRLNFNENLRIADTCIQSQNIRLLERSFYLDGFQNDRGFDIYNLQC